MAVDAAKDLHTTVVLIVLQVLADAIAQCLADRTLTVANAADLAGRRSIAAVAARA